MSMVDIMMEGVVRKNSTTNRVKLMPSHWSHQRTPWTERFFLQRATPDKGLNLPGTGHLQHQPHLWLRQVQPTLGRTD